MNNHYVPRLILRKFNDNLCLYNVKTGELKENIPIKNAYVIKGYYDDETEEQLHLRVESQFGNLLANHILKCENQVVLDLNQLNLVKKFLTIAVLRSINCEKFTQVEKYFYAHIDEQVKLLRQLNGESTDDLKSSKPFEEKQIEGETPFEYWMRTLNVILDTDGTPEQILKHELKTYPAYRWASVINGAYLAFWDAPDNGDEFVITDIGMTSENEKGWNGITVRNTKKLECLKKAFMEEKNPSIKSDLFGKLLAMENFTENFQMFTISPKRMIVLICPFFKARHNYNLDFELSNVTSLTNEKLFEPNGNYYKYGNQSDGSFKRDAEDRYIYDIKKLTREEISYCNALFLDRIDTYLGFSSLNSVVHSILKYERLTRFPKRPRNDYRSLYKIIWERYKAN